MAFYIGRRILQSIPLLLLITLLSFGLMNLVPYDAVDSISNSKMTEAQREEKREEYGLNDPMPVQYFRWLKNILRGEIYGYGFPTPSFWCFPPTLPPTFWLWRWDFTVPAKKENGRISS